MLKLNLVIALTFMLLLSGCAVNKSEDLVPNLESNVPVSGDDESATVNKVSEQSKVVPESTLLAVGDENKDMQTEQSNVNVKVEAPVNQVASCDNATCFIEKFQNCQPAFFDSELGGFASYHYEILGPQSGKCRMMMKYTANPNLAWVNKEMTCLYDTNEDFSVATEAAFNSLLTKENIYNCSGPLADILLTL